MQNRFGSDLGLCPFAKRCLADLPQPLPMGRYVTAAFRNEHKKRKNKRADDNAQSSSAAPNDLFVVRDGLWTPKLCKLLHSLTQIDIVFTCWYREAAGKQAHDDVRVLFATDRRKCRKTSANCAAAMISRTIWDSAVFAADQCLPKWKRIDWDKAISGDFTWFSPSRGVPDLESYREAMFLFFEWVLKVELPLRTNTKKIFFDMWSCKF